MLIASHITAAPSAAHARSIRPLAWRAIGVIAGDCGSFAGSFGRFVVGRMSANQSKQAGLLQLDASYRKTMIKPE